MESRLRWAGHDVIDITRVARIIVQELQANGQSLEISRLGARKLGAHQSRITDSHECIGHVALDGLGDFFHSRKQKKRLILIDRASTQKTFQWGARR
jgi:hypothetical protein